ncbi:MAG: hypothetical protein JNM84_16620 [Planctomycetes bacterium]|nr:hypothetical protein [Planctomycetota bacterium]
MSLVPRPSSVLFLGLALAASATALRAQLDHESAPAGGSSSFRLPEGQQRPQPEGLNVIYANGPYVNLPGGGFGGLDASVLQNSSRGHTSFGYSGNQAATGFRLADEFNVPGGQLWNLESVKVFAYRTVAIGAPPQLFDLGVVRIWDGDPSSGTANIVFGDDTTNRLVSSVFDNAYRVTETTLTNNQRGVTVNELRIGKLLKPGTYWVEYGLNTTAAAGTAFFPPIAITNQDATGNGLQLNVSTGVWTPITMTTTSSGLQPVGLPFELCGTVACCWEPNLGTNLNHGDDTITNNLALGFNFPLPGELPGGATTPVVSVCSNGFVGLGGAFTADFTPTTSEFTSQGHRIAVPWDDYVPNTVSAPRRQVWFNALPGRAVATWRRVLTFNGGPSLSMVQLQMFPNGSFFINVWNHEPVTIRTPLFGVAARGSSPSVAVDMSLGHIGTPGTATIYESFTSGTSDLSGFIYCFEPKNDGIGATYDISISDACCNDAANTSYGSGCAGLGLTSTTPLAGQSITLSMSGVSGTATLAVMTFGVTQASIAIDPLNAPGCDLLTGLEFPGALPIDPLNPRLSTVIPCNAKFFGNTVYVQGFVLDPAANALGLAATNGVCLTIGND